jgi:zinc D-Ala-D-Ala carboxypeptidase
MFPRNWKRLLIILMAAAVVAGGVFFRKRAAVPPVANGSQRRQKLQPQVSAEVAAPETNQPPVVPPSDYLQPVERLPKVESFFEQLGISDELVRNRQLVPHAEASELVVAEVGEDGRKHQLIPEAAAAWRLLRESALSDGITLRIASAFRSVNRQAEIIRLKLNRGIPIEEILTVDAPPGYSEHHTGRAVDVFTPGGPLLETEFERTEAFKWLTANAGGFGFTLSYPRENPDGYGYEPWHWCFVGSEQKC